MKEQNKITEKTSPLSSVGETSGYLFKADKPIVDDKEKAYFNIELYCYCPMCSNRIDLEERSDFWVELFKKWVNNEKGADACREMVSCCGCGHEFLVTNIER